MRVNEETLRKRKRVDNIAKGIIWSLSSVGVIVFVSILFYVFANGVGLLSFDLLTSDYYSVATTISIDEAEGPYYCSGSDRRIGLGGSGHC